MDWLVSDEAGVIAAVAASLATAIAAGLAARATHLSRMALEANVVASFLSEYSASDMQDSLRKLSELADDVDLMNVVSAYSDASITEAVAIDSHPMEHYNQIDIHRRKIYYYFKRASRLYEEKFIRKNAYNSIIDVNALNLFFDLVYPLSFLQHPELKRDKPSSQRIIDSFLWIKELRDQGVSIGRIYPADQYGPRLH